jgi:hypothetical protein
LRRDKMSETKTIKKIIKEIESYELWQVYCKFVIDRGFNITDILENFRAVQGVTVVTSTRLSKTADREIYLIKFKFIKSIPWPQYLKFVKHICIHDLRPGKKIPGLKNIMFFRNPERIL